MLVLSRRPGEKILLPTVPAVLKVISSQGGLVRIGIEAPSHVPILREEVCQGDKTRARSDVPAGSEPEPLSSPGRPVRNRLDNLALGLTLLRMHLVDGDPAVRQLLDGMEEELRVLGLHLAVPAVNAQEPEEPATRRTPTRAGASRRRVRPV